MRRYIFVISLFLLLVKVSAQNIGSHGLKDYGAGEISSNLITQICQDSYGFIWVSTAYGLNKFDGVRFTQYLHDSKDDASILSNNVHSLMLDRKNTLWVGYNNGLQYYQPEENSFKTISFPDEIIPHIKSIVELHDGQIWVATSGWGMFSIDKVSSEAIPLNEINNLTGRFVGYVYEDRKNNIWIGIDNEGIVRIDPKTKKSRKFTKPDIPNNNINNIVEDGSGHLYVSFPLGICALDESADQFIRINTTNGEGLSYRLMMVNSTGVVYIGTDGDGLKYIDRNTNKIRSVENETMAFDYNTAKVYALAEDRDRNLWVGCFQKGLLMMPNEHKQFNHWNVGHKGYRLGNIINSICIDHDNDIWCSIDNEGLYKLNNKGNVVKYFSEVKDITKIFEDSERTLWISSSSRGLAKLNKNTGHLDFLGIPFKGYMKNIAEDHNHNLYISTFNSGFIRYNIKTRDWEQFSMNQQNSSKGKLGNDWINAILCDTEGMVWFGHYKGISCFDPKQNRFLDIQDEALASQVCISLAEGMDGEIWIGTYNGLFKLNKKTFQTESFTVENGLSNNVICGLAQGNDGNMWVSTFKGINQVMTKDNRIVSFYTGSGLVDKIYNRGVYFQTQNGSVYFGGNSGITFFSPQNISAPDYNREIFTTNVYVHNRPINTNSLSDGKPIIGSNVLNENEFHFSFEDNTFTFEFSTFDFIDPENIYYEYRLKELSGIWNTTRSGISQITYNHLNHGEYTLEVRTNKYGTSSPIKQLKIKISPPWYQSVWAYIIYFCSIAAIGMLVANMIRRKRNEQISESKLQFFINISHEIRSPLTLIISPMEKLLSGNFDNDTMRTLKSMHRNATRILGLVNQLLDIRKLDKGQMILNFRETEMISFVKEVMEVFEYQSNKREIHFVFQHKMESLMVWIDRNNFDKILMNILSNAFKYTSNKGNVIVTLTTGIDDDNWGVLRNYVEISIIDSGIGLDEEKTEKIFDRFYQGQSQETYATIGSGIGLNLARTLVELHRGVIFAENRTDAQGSCFIIRIPLGNKHLKKEEMSNCIYDARPILQQGVSIDDNLKLNKSVKRKTNYKVLIVDDEEDIRDYLKEELSDTYRILCANNGVEGLESALNQLPDLIISDVVMPEMDGFAFVRKLRNNNNISHIPVILLTSKVEHKDRIEGIDKGADAYLTKPFNIEELLVTIKSLISNRSALKGKFSGAQEQEDKIKPVEFKTSNELLMEKVMTIINNNLSNPNLNVEMLVSQIGLSRVQLHRKLKELTGISTGEFIRNIRLKQSASLLREKRMNISQVAYSVGFINQTHFSTAFKKYYGVSPSDYINKQE